MKTSLLKLVVTFFAIYTLGIHLKHIESVQTIEAEEAYAATALPKKVGLQVGHWQNEELPPELARLIGNTGAQAGGVTELEINYTIAVLTAEILREQGVTVDILPATVPKGYQADVFVSIHADGSHNPSASGYKVAAPWRDQTGKAEYLAALIGESYQQATGMKLDHNITANMTDYYAFAWWKYEHAIHPETPAAILETGFVSSKADREIIAHQPQMSAQALASAISVFLESEASASQISAT